MRTDPFDYDSYIPRYTFSWLVKPMWLIIKFLHRVADLTLVPSVAIGRDLQAARVTAVPFSSPFVQLYLCISMFECAYCNEQMFSDTFLTVVPTCSCFCSSSNGEPEKPLVYVGCLGVEKSLDFLKRIMDRLPGSRIAFIGDCSFRSAVLFLKMSLSRCSPACPQCSRARCKAKSCHRPMPVGITLGFVVLEAMSSGVPVVGARAGGIPDIIPEDQEGRTSFLYTPGDVDDCVGKIEQLLSCEELWEAMGRAARKEMKFDWQAATRTSSTALLSGSGAGRGCSAAAAALQVGCPEVGAG
ncbi:hypothetical protein U9M48_011298 [Paspalum notatum var. saurae]|uniref:Glycosyl transferase family 1 domain-containing protein n=1 Tax=Paspalum notatum var. saurae TaxID=547442 RepID=A0AAQ3WH81_PASNO